MSTYNHLQGDSALSSELLSEIEKRVRAAGTAERAAQEKRYLKSDLEHYGTSVPELRKIEKAVLRESVPNDRESIMQLAGDLWARPVHELRMLATFVLASRERLLGAEDLPWLERLLRESRTWALVDTLSPWVVGPVVGREPAAHATLMRWSVDEDFWLRRAAVLAYQLPLRRGEAVFERFTGIADPLLEDKEFFVRKAIGWMLRERTKLRPDEVFSWLLPRRARASRLTLREAAKHLTERQREELLG